VDEVRITRYDPMDAMDVLSFSDTDLIITYPPTYVGGYERLYAKLTATLKWGPQPAYVDLSELVLKNMLDQCKQRDYWMWVTDQEVEGEEVLARVATAGKPVFCYGNMLDKNLLVNNHTEISKRFPRLWTDEPGDKIELCLLTGPLRTACDMRWLKTPGKSVVSGTAFGVLVDGALAGAFTLTVADKGKGQICEMLFDYCVDTTSFKRAIKLIVACALSREAQDLMRMRSFSNFTQVWKTVLTDKPVSMKYRGLYELDHRGEGKLRYKGQAGKWTLSEVGDWWRNEQRKQVKA
jgi:hypothetical protein